MKKKAFLITLILTIIFLFNFNLYGQRQEKKNDENIEKLGLFHIIGKGGYIQFLDDEWKRFEIDKNWYAGGEIYFNIANIIYLGADSFYVGKSDAESTLSFSTLGTISAKANFTFIPILISTKFVTEFFDFLNLGFGVGVGVSYLKIETFIDNASAPSLSIKEWPWTVRAFLELNFRLGNFFFGANGGFLYATVPNYSNTMSSFNAGGQIGVLF